MKLLEFRGKELLKQVGIRVPPGMVVNNKSYINLSFHKEKYRNFFFDHKHVVIKAQIPEGGRKKKGLIVESSDYKESLKLIDTLYHKKYMDRPVTQLLIEKKLNVTEEYFLAILYDTNTRSPCVLFSKQGGIDVEESQHVIRFPFSAISGLDAYQARHIAKAAGFQGTDILRLASFIMKLYDCFIRFDCKSCEVNPILKTNEGLLYAGDAKIVIDDNAVSRQDQFHDVTDIEDVTVLTSRELQARKIDYHDYRGVAGKTFVEMDGDIAVIASGGGASLTCMDALIEAGGKPANYTEYSGNPPREKVRKLTEVTLSKPNLKGCLVIGGTANFTDIYETLAGFMEGLQALPYKPTYPIVIRRGGPNYKKAFTMINEIAARDGYDITLFGPETPMTHAARVAVQKMGGTDGHHSL